MEKARKTVIICNIIAFVAFGLSGILYLASGKTMVGIIECVVGLLQLPCALINYMALKEGKK